VLYLPLYELDGASFMSRDAYGHLCTVTGALWKPNGRLFDGDDHIAIADHAALDVSPTMTVLVWSNATTPVANYRTFFCHYDLNGQRAWALSGHGSGAGAGYGRLQTLASDDGSFDAGHQYDLYTNAVVIDGSWHLFGITWDAGSGILYVDGAAPAQTEATAEISTIHASTADLTIGAQLNSGAAARWIIGTIGEVWLYNRALSSLEIQRNYLATKWRYQ